MRWAILSILTCFLGGCINSDPLNYESSIGVPEGTIAERQAWGEKHLGISYQQAINWINKVKVVRENVGVVTQVAPVGKPNYLEYYFTDGLFGNLTIEIIGDKGKAVLTVEDLHPCYLKNDGKVYICFKKGILSTEYNRIPVHSSGVREVEFNRVENQEKIAKLTEQIESYGNSPTPEEATILENLLIQRYRLYAENENYKLAIQDLELAIAIMPRGFDESSSYKDLEETERDNARRFDRYQYWLAKAYYNSKQFDKAAALFKQSLDTKLSRGLNRIFDWQQMELWIARTRASQTQIADQELKQSLAFEEQKKNSCYSIYGQYLLGNLIAEALLEKSTQSVAKYCAHNDPYQRVALAYFYIGQKEIAEGKIKSGRKNLQKSLENNYLLMSHFEYMAVKELSQVLEIN